MPTGFFRQRQSKSGTSADDPIAGIKFYRQSTNMGLGRVALGNFVIAAALTVCAIPAMAEQLRFTGRTTANLDLIKDTLRHIQLIGQARNDCGVISAVEAAVHPQDFQPAEAYRVGEGQVTYETWSATMCDTEVKFLISFWAAPEGGTMFAVGYPYPADAPDS